MRSAGKKSRSEKIVLIGAASSGKTSIVNRFAHDRFSAGSEATIGAAFISKVINIDGTDLKLEIWDTGGSEKYRSLAPMYYRDARAAVVVFDVTSQESFADASEWVQEFREKGVPGALMVGAANKCDLVDKRVISSADANDFSFGNQLEFIVDTSALTGAGINQLFNDLGKALLALPSAPGQDDVLVADLDQPSPASNSGCNC